jgi:hypothetical protein
MPIDIYKATRFLNVDLDLYSRSNLQPLIAALGQRVFTLHLGREGQTYSAHLELSREPKTADLAIRTLAALIHTLPKAARKLWDTANVRDFNVGVQAAMRPHSYAIPLAYETIKIASALKARIVFTIYAAEVPKSVKWPPNKSSQRKPAMSQRR